MTQGSQFQQPPTGGSDQSKGDVAKAQGQQVADHAKNEAASVAQDAKREGQQVVETATSEVSQLADTAGTQAKRLMDQAKSELGGHAGEQQQRAASSIRGLADELHTMVRSNDQSGPMNDLAAQAASKAGEVAHWLESREPGDLVNDVRRFAARKPGAFLAIAAGVGLLAGRLTRGLTADDHEGQGQSSSDQTRSGSAGQPRHLADTRPPVTEQRSHDYSAGTSYSGSQPGGQFSGHPLSQQAGLSHQGGQPGQDLGWSDTGRAPGQEQTWQTPRPDAQYGDRDAR